MKCYIEFEFKIMNQVNYELFHYFTLNHNIIQNE